MASGVGEQHDHDIAYVSGETVFCWCGAWRHLGKHVWTEGNDVQV